MYPLYIFVLPIFHSSAEKMSSYEFYCLVDLDSVYLQNCEAVL